MKIEKPQSDNCLLTIAPLAILQRSTIEALTTAPDLLTFYKSLQAFTVWVWDRGDFFCWAPLFNRFDNVLADFIYYSGLEDVIGNCRQPDSHRPDSDPPPGLTTELIVEIMRVSYLVIESCAAKPMFNSLERAVILLDSMDQRIVEYAIPLVLYATHTAKRARKVADRQAITEIHARLAVIAPSPTTVLSTLRIHGPHPDTPNNFTNITSDPMIFYSDSSWQPEAEAAIILTTVTTDSETVFTNSQLIEIFRSAGCLERPPPYSGSGGPTNELLSGTTPCLQRTPPPEVDSLNFDSTRGVRENWEESLQLERTKNNLIKELVRKRRIPEHQARYLRHRIRVLLNSTTVEQRRISMCISMEATITLTALSPQNLQVVLSVNPGILVEVAYLLRCHRNLTFDTMTTLRDFLLTVVQERVKMKDVASLLEVSAPHGLLADIIRYYVGNQSLYPAGTSLNQQIPKVLYYTSPTDLLPESIVAGNTTNHDATRRTDSGESTNNLRVFVNNPIRRCLDSSIKENSLDEESHGDALNIYSDLINATEEKQKNIIDENLKIQQHAELVAGFLDLYHGICYNPPNASGTALAHPSLVAAVLNVLNVLDYRYLQAQVSAAKLLDLFWRYNFPPIRSTLREFKALSNAGQRAKYEASKIYNLVEYCGKLDIPVTEALANQSDFLQTDLRNILGRVNRGLGVPCTWSRGTVQHYKDCLYWQIFEELANRKCLLVALLKEGPISEHWSNDGSVNLAEAFLSHYGDAVKLILQNPEKFGPRIYASAVQLLNDLLAEDASTGRMFAEHGVISDYFMSMMNTQILNSESSLQIVPSATSAIFVHYSGVEESEKLGNKPLFNLINVVSFPDLVRFDRVSGIAAMIGSIVEQIMRNHRQLMPPIIKELNNLIISFGEVAESLEPWKPKKALPIFRQIDRDLHTTTSCGLEHLNVPDLNTQHYYPDRLSNIARCLQCITQRSIMALKELMRQGTFKGILSLCGISRHPSKTAPALPPLYLIISPSHPANALLRQMGLSILSTSSERPEINFGSSKDNGIGYLFHIALLTAIDTLRLLLEADLLLNRAMYTEEPNWLALDRHVDGSYNNVGWNSAQRESIRNIRRKLLDSMSGLGSSLHIVCMILRDLNASTRFPWGAMFSSAMCVLTPLVSTIFDRFLRLLYRESNILASVDCHLILGQRASVHEHPNVRRNRIFVKKNCHDSALFSSCFRLPGMDPTSAGINRVSLQHTHFLWTSLSEYAYSSPTGILESDAPNDNSLIYEGFNFMENSSEMPEEFAFAYDSSSVMKECMRTVCLSLRMFLVASARLANAMPPKRPEDAQPPRHYFSRLQKLLAIHLSGTTTKLLVHNVFKNSAHEIINDCRRIAEVLDVTFRLHVDERNQGTVWAVTVDSFYKNHGFKHLAKSVHHVIETQLLLALEFQHRRGVSTPSRFIKELGLYKAKMFRNLSDEELDAALIVVGKSVQTSLSYCEKITSWKRVFNSRTAINLQRHSYPPTYAQVAASVNLDDWLQSEPYKVPTEVSADTSTSGNLSLDDAASFSATSLLDSIHVTLGSQCLIKWWNLVSDDSLDIYGSDEIGSFSLKSKSSQELENREIIDLVFCSRSFSSLLRSLHHIVDAQTENRKSHGLGWIRANTSAGNQPAEDLDQVSVSLGFSVARPNDQQQEQPGANRAPILIHPEDPFRVALIEMGFAAESVDRALQRTGGADLDAAVTWLLGATNEHDEDEGDNEDDDEEDEDEDEDEEEDEERDEEPAEEAAAQLNSETFDSLESYEGVVEFCKLCKVDKLYAISTPQTVFVKMSEVSLALTFALNIEEFMQQEQLRLILDLAAYILLQYDKSSLYEIIAEDPGMLKICHKARLRKGQVNSFRYIEPKMAEKFARDICDTLIKRAYVASSRLNTKMAVIVDGFMKLMSIQLKKNRSKSAGEESNPRDDTLQPNEDTSEQPTSGAEPEENASEGRPRAEVPIDGIADSSSRTPPQQKPSSSLDCNSSIRLSLLISTLTDRLSIMTVHMETDKSVWEIPRGVIADDNRLKLLRRSLSRDTILRERQEEFLSQCESRRKELAAVFNDAELNNLAGIYQNTLQAIFTLLCKITKLKLIDIHECNCQLVSLIHIIVRLVKAYNNTQIGNLAFKELRQIASTDMIIPIPMWAACSEPYNVFDMNSVDDDIQPLPLADKQKRKLPDGRFGQSYATARPPPITQPPPWLIPALVTLSQILPLIELEVHNTNSQATPNSTPTATPTDISFQPASDPERILSEHTQTVLVTALLDLIHIFPGLCPMMSLALFSILTPITLIYKNSLTLLHWAPPNSCNEDGNPSYAPTVGGGQGVTYTGGGGLGLLLRLPKTAQFEGSLRAMTAICCNLMEDPAILADVIVQQILNAFRTQGLAVLKTEILKPVAANEEAPTHPTAANEEAPTHPAAANEEPPTNPAATNEEPPTVQDIGPKTPEETVNILPLDILLSQCYGIARRNPTLFESVVCAICIQRRETSPSGEEASESGPVMLQLVDGAESEAALRESPLGRKLRKLLNSAGKPPRNGWTILRSLAIHLEAFMCVQSCSRLIPFTAIQNLLERKIIQYPGQLLSDVMPYPLPPPRIPRHGDPYPSNVNDMLQYLSTAKSQQASNDLKFVKPNAVYPFLFRPDSLLYLMQSLISAFPGMIPFLARTPPASLVAEGLNSESFTPSSSLQAKSPFTNLVVSPPLHFDGHIAPNIQNATGGAASLFSYIWRCLLRHAMILSHQMFSDTREPISAAESCPSGSTNFLAAPKELLLLAAPATANSWWFSPGVSLLLKFQSLLVSIAMGNPDVRKKLLVEVVAHIKWLTSRGMQKAPSNRHSHYAYIPEESFVLITFFVLNLLFRLTHIPLPVLSPVELSKETEEGSELLKSAQWSLNLVELQGLRGSLVRLLTRLDLNRDDTGVLTHILVKTFGVLTRPTFLGVTPAEPTVLEKEFNTAIQPRRQQRSLEEEEEENGDEFEYEMDLDSGWGGTDDTLAFRLLDSDDAVYTLSDLEIQDGRNQDGRSNETDENGQNGGYEDFQEAMEGLSESGFHDEDEVDDEVDSDDDESDDEADEETHNHEDDMSSCPSEEPDDNLLPSALPHEEEPTDGGVVPISAEVPSERNQAEIDEELGDSEEEDYDEDEADVPRVRDDYEEDEIRESPLDGGLHGSTTLDLDENDVALPTEGSRTILFPNDPDVRGSSANADLLDNETGHLNAARHVANMNTITVESDVDDEEDEEDEDSEEHQLSIDPVVRVLRGTAGPFDDDRPDRESFDAMVEYDEGEEMPYLVYPADAENEETDGQNLPYSAGNNDMTRLTDLLNFILPRGSTGAIPQVGRIGHQNIGVTNDFNAIRGTGERQTPGPWLIETYNRTSASGQQALLRSAVDGAANQVVAQLGCSVPRDLFVPPPHPLLQSTPTVDAFGFLEAPTSSVNRVVPQLVLPPDTAWQNLLSVSFSMHPLLGLNDSAGLVNSFGAFWDPWAARPRQTEYWDLYRQNHRRNTRVQVPNPPSHPQVLLRELYQDLERRRDSGMLRTIDVEPQRPPTPTQSPCEEEQQPTTAAPETGTLEVGQNTSANNMMVPEPTTGNETSNIQAEIESRDEESAAEPMDRIEISGSQQENSRIAEELRPTTTSAELRPTTTSAELRPTTTSAELRPTTTSAELRPTITSEAGETMHENVTQLAFEPMEEIANGPIAELTRETRLRLHQLVSQNEVRTLNMVPLGNTAFGVQGLRELAASLGLSARQLMEACSIDVEFLEAIPFEVREESILAQISSISLESIRRLQRQNLAAFRDQEVENVPIVRAIPRDLLNALPESVAEEVDVGLEMAVSMADNPRTNNEMDNATFLATLDSALRHDVLLTAGEDFLDTLPPNYFAEAQRLRRRSIGGSLREDLALPTPPRAVVNNRGNAASGRGQFMVNRPSGESQPIIAPDRVLELIETTSNNLSSIYDLLLAANTNPIVNDASRAMPGYGAAQSSMLMLNGDFRRLGFGSEEHLDDPSPPPLAATTHHHPTAQSFLVPIVPASLMPSSRIMWFSDGNNNQLRTTTTFRIPRSVQDQFDVVGQDTGSSENFPLQSAGLASMLSHLFTSAAGNSRDVNHLSITLTPPAPLLIDIAGNNMISSRRLTAGTAGFQNARGGSRANHRPYGVTATLRLGNLENRTDQNRNTGPPIRSMLSSIMNALSIRTPMQTTAAPGQNGPLAVQPTVAWHLPNSTEEYMLPLVYPVEPPGWNANGPIQNAESPCVTDPLSVTTLCRLFYINKQSTRRDLHRAFFNLSISNVKSRYSLFQHMMLILWKSSEDLHSVHYPARSAEAEATGFPLNHIFNSLGGYIASYSLLGVGRDYAFLTLYSQPAGPIVTLRTLEHMRSILAVHPQAAEFFSRAVLHPGYFEPNQWPDDTRISIEEEQQQEEEDEEVAVMLHESIRKLRKKSHNDSGPNRSFKVHPSRRSKFVYPINVLTDLLNSQFYQTKPHHINHIDAAIAYLLLGTQTPNFPEEKNEGPPATQPATLINSTAMPSTSETSAAGSIHDRILEVLDINSTETLVKTFVWGHDSNTMLRMTADITGDTRSEEGWLWDALQTNSSIGAANHQLMAKINHRLVEDAKHKEWAMGSLKSNMSLLLQRVAEILKATSQSLGYSSDKWFSSPASNPATNSDNDKHFIEMAVLAFKTDQILAILPRVIGGLREIFFETSNSGCIQPLSEEVAQAYVDSIGSTGASLAAAANTAENNVSEVPLAATIPGPLMAYRQQMDSSVIVGRRGSLIKNTVTCETKYVLGRLAHFLSGLASEVKLSEALEGVLRDISTVYPQLAFVPASDDTVDDDQIPFMTQGAAEQSSSSIQEGGYISEEGRNPGSIRRRKHHRRSSPENQNIQNSGLALPLPVVLNRLVPLIEVYMGVELLTTAAELGHYSIHPSFLAVQSSASSSSSVANNNQLNNSQSHWRTTSGRGLLLPTFRGAAMHNFHGHLRRILADPDCHLTSAHDRFMTFCEIHQKPLNGLMRQQPNLLSNGFAPMLDLAPMHIWFDNKRHYFRQRIRQSREGQRYEPIRLLVRRQHVFTDSFHQLRMRSGNELKGKLVVRFQNEEGLDAGGLTREWFSILAKEMFNPDYALFRREGKKAEFNHPNPLSNVNPDHLHFFRFIGMVIGKSVYDGQYLDCYFTRPFYKLMLGRPIAPQDAESIDPEFYKSLQTILEHPVDSLALDFTTDVDEFGKTTVVELKPGGADIPVTDETKQEYVISLCKHKIMHGLQQQLNAFLEGFYELMPAQLLSIFDDKELELLISGLPTIDLTDLKAYTEYRNYLPSDETIKWFWEILEEYDQNQLATFLQFATGTSRVPLGGFQNLMGMRGPQKFVIVKAFGDDRLPAAHTCFNQLDIPAYSSKEKMKHKLTQAITEGKEGFGFV